ncbi:MAG: hypothetical protein ACLPSF_13265 [Methylocella sp.]
MTIKTSSRMAASFLALLMVSAPAAGAATFQGTLDIELTLKLNPAIPDGTSITAAIYASAGGSSGNKGFSNRNSLYVSAVASKGKASFVIPVAYGWTLLSPSGIFSAIVDVSAYFTKGSERLSFLSSYFVEQAVPPNGATTPLKIVGSL